MTKGSKRGTPAGLGAVGRRMHRDLMDEFAIDDAAGKALLLNACQAADRIAAARAEIAAQGLFLTDRLGRRYANPAQQVELSAGKQLLAAIRALRLEGTE